MRLARQCTINFTLESTLSQIRDQMLAVPENGVKEVKFFSLNGSRLPLSEKVANQREYPVLCQIDGERTYALNFSQEYQIEARQDRERNIKDEEHYFDFARDLGLKGYDLFALPYFSHKLINSLPPK